MISHAAPAVAPRRSFALGGLLATVVLAFGCHGGPSSPLARLDEARTLAASIRVQFNKADDASNRAVMADTDEASISFARDAAATTKGVERDVKALAPLLQDLGYPKALRSFEEFQKHFTEYRKLDREILALAVENTNLKAQALEFGAARSAADGFRDSLGSVASKVAPSDRSRAGELVAKATLDVREIQVLLAPHIASRSDAEMTRMEQEMAALDRAARDAVNAVNDLIPPDARAQPAAPLLALDKFKEITAQIVELSRRNTNVRSFDLALRSKPALATACDDDLRALQEALAKAGSNATR